MFYPNYYPYNMNYNYGYKNNFNKFNNNINYNQHNPNFNTQNNQKKDIDSNKVETIPFKDYTNCENNINSNNIEKQGKFNIFGLSFEIDDLILIGLIILLFLESDKNYALIIILGLILLNVNLGDILNIF